MSVKVNSIGRTNIEVSIEGTLSSIECVARSTASRSIVKVSKSSRWFQLAVDGWRYDLSQQEPGTLLLKPSEPNGRSLPGFGLPEETVGRMHLEIHINEPVWVCKDNGLLVITSLKEPNPSAIFIYLAAGEHTGRPGSLNLPALPVFPPEAEIVTLLPDPAADSKQETDSERPTFLTKKNPRDGAEMVLIPDGDFRMGNKIDSDYPYRTNTLPDFFIYKDLVTVAQYMKFCSETGHQQPDAPKFDPSWEQLDHPIVNVSLYDAWEYCKWAGVRMPTEPEWEKAARGIDGRLFPWGNEWQEGKCVNGSNSQGGTGRVGQFDDSPYGLSDMAGNVCQLTTTSYEIIYRDRGDTRPDRIVVKGFPWKLKWDPSFEFMFWTANRQPARLDWYSEGAGFRCAADSDAF
ncbi:MAG: formylglycine-generating enzyme family protein [Terracidiphilus sp.]